MKILIATMTCGEGHNAIARSLRDALRSRHEVKIVDAYGEKRGWNGAYLFFVRRFPALYTFVWQIGRRVSAKKRYRGLAMQGIRGAVPNLERALSEFDPDIVICTHNQVSNALCWMKIHNRFRKPLYSVFFDYVNCPYWEGSVLCYGVFTPNPITHAALLERGFCEEQLIPTGFPVNPKFDDRQTKAEARASLGISENAFVALTVNGGAGIGNTKGLVKALLKADTAGRELVILAVCGRNHAAESKLAKYCATHSISNVRVLGFVDNVPELMRASDLYFCRGGGGAVSEAMECGVPIVIREGVSAQEAENKKLLLSKGLCYGMKHVSDATSIVTKHIGDPDMAQEMQARVSAFRISNGAQNIARYIEGSHDPS